MSDSPLFSIPSLPAASRIARGQNDSPRDPRAAIADAAARTGVDFDYLLAQARLESSLDPAAKARTSSAGGLFQFIESTWIDTVDRHGEALGVGSASGGSRSQIMAMRFDPRAASLMAGALASDNKAALTGVLGREPDSAELYMAHFLGASGAAKFLRQLQTSPGTSAAAILPAPAAANRSIFYEPGGAARSVGDVMDLMRGKMAYAMAQDSGGPTMGVAPANYAMGGLAGEFAEAAGLHGRSFQTQATSANFSSFNAARQTYAPLPATSMSAPSLPARSATMAETLRSSFAIAGDAMPASARQHVQTAYGRLKAFNL